MRKLWLVLALVIALLSACADGDQDKPTIAEIIADGEWVQMPGPNGETLDCFYYAADAYHQGWLVFPCLPATTVPPSSDPDIVVQND